MNQVQVLIVEDEAIVSMDLRYKLEDLGYGVPAAVGSGEEASQLHPDLVLMDVHLSGDIDGIDAAARIRQRFDIPVGYLTAYADEATLDRAKLTEPFGYLLKPLERKALQSVVEVTVHKHRIEKRLKESEQWQSALVDTLYDVALTLSENCDLQDKANKVIKNLAQIADCDGATLRIPDISAGGFVLLAGTGDLDGAPPSDLIPFGQGLVNRAFEGEMVVATTDYAKHPDSISDLVVARLKSAVAIPIMFDDRAIGVFTFVSRNAWTFDEQLVNLLTTVARQIGPLLAHAKLRQELDATDEIARILTATIDIGDVYARFAGEMNKLVEFDGIAINLIDHQAQTFSLQYTYGANVSSRAVGRSVPLEESATGFVASTGLTLLREDISVEARFGADRAMAAEGLRSFITSPLICQGQVIGTIGLFSRQTGAFGAASQSALTSNGTLHIIR